MLILHGCKKMNGYPITLITFITMWWGWPFSRNGYLHHNVMVVTILSKCDEGNHSINWHGAALISLYFFASFWSWLKISLQIAKFLPHYDDFFYIQSNYISGLLENDEAACVLLLTLTEYGVQFQLSDLITIPACG